MAIQYNLTATEILQALGYAESAGRQELEDFEKEEGIKLPPALFEFLALRYDIDLMRTSDIWQIPYFSYVDIEERKEYWEENPDEREGDEYYEFSQIPREEWPQRVANHLQIGSDYAAGVVNFGICIHDLAKDNPPVYILNEDNSLCDWQLLNETLNEFLLCVLGDVLSCQYYSTSIRILDEHGWDFQTTEFHTQEEAAEALLEKGIDLSHLEYANGNVFYSCCADKEQHILYLIKTDSTKCNVYEIAKRT